MHMPLEDHLKLNKQLNAAHWNPGQCFLVGGKPLLFGRFWTPSPHSHLLSNLIGMTLVYTAPSI